MVHKRKLVKCESSRYLVIFVVANDFMQSTLRVTIRSSQTAKRYDSRNAREVAECTRVRTKSAGTVGFDNFEYSHLCNAYPDSTRLIPSFCCLFSQDSN